MRIIPKNVPKLKMQRNRVALESVPTQLQDKQTVKSSVANSLLFYFTGIFQRINSRGLGCLPPVGGEVSRSDRGVDRQTKVPNRR